MAPAFLHIIYKIIHHLTKNYKKCHKICYLSISKRMSICYDGFERKRYQKAFFKGGDQ